MEARTAVRVWTVAAALLAACGGGGGGEEEGGPGTVEAPATAAEFCGTLYATFAERHAACSKAALAWAEVRIDATRLCAAPVSSVESGRASYDTAAAGRCLAWLESATCTTLRAVLDGSVRAADCDGAFDGTVASSVGSEDCYADQDCVSGRCSAVTGGACPGYCFAGNRAGEECFESHDCAPGLHCYFGSIWPDGTCQPLANHPGDGQACSYSVGCKPGYYCSKATLTADGTCKPLATADVSCVSASPLVDPAAPGFACVGGVGVALLGPGEACSPSPDRCGPGLYCGPGDTCQELTGVGEACIAYDGEYVGCIGGYCDSVQHTCVAETPSFCYTDWDCAPYGVCVGRSCVSACLPPQ